MAPIVVVGLGNPGPEYETTRHNVGFLVVDLLSGRWNRRFRSGPGDSLVASAELQGNPVLLMKPLTFMNNSGSAVADVLRQYDPGPASLLIILDDFALPIGALRLRPRGSDGGHNGLASIIEHLGTDEVPRLRCGIGRDAPPPGTAMADFVLSRFDAGEEDTVRDMIARAADAVTEFVIGGIDSAMNRFNT